MKIQRARAENSEAILELFAKGAEIVIVEYPKGIVIDEGSRCHVFVRDNAEPFVDTLNDIAGCIKVISIDKSLPVCLYSLYNFAQTVKIIKKQFPDIVFEMVE